MAQPPGQRFSLADSCWRSTSLNPVSLSRDQQSYCGIISGSYFKNDKTHCLYSKTHDFLLLTNFKAAILHQNTHHTRARAEEEGGKRRANYTGGGLVTRWTEPGWEFYQDTGESNLIFVAHAMGDLITPGSQDLGLMSHLKDGTVSPCLHWRIGISLLVSEERRHPSGPPTPLPTCWCGCRLID